MLSCNLEVVDDNKIKAKIERCVDCIPSTHIAIASSGKRTVVFTVYALNLSTRFVQSPQAFVRLMPKPMVAAHQYQPGFTAACLCMPRR